MSKHNPVAKNLKVNRPQTIPAKKGAGSYKRAELKLAFFKGTRVGRS